MNTSIAENDKFVLVRNNYIQKLKNLNIFNDDIINNIESSIFNYSSKYSNNKKVQYVIYIYNHKFNNLINDIVNNDKLIYDINNNNIVNICNLSRLELNPNVWKKRYDKYNTSVESINYISKSNIYTCKSCKKNECYVYELQTRSADEPMTIFITCINCGKKWRN